MTDLLLKVVIIKRMTELVQFNAGMTEGEEKRRTSSKDDLSTRKNRKWMEYNRNHTRSRSRSSRVIMDRSKSRSLSGREKGFKEREAKLIL